MNIKNYKILISNLPVRQQCFTTKRKTWLKVENKTPWLKSLNDKLFGENKTLAISRQDIFETKEPRETIIKTIYWGYNAGMRGNNFQNIIEHIEPIENALWTLKNKTNPITTDFNDLKQIFKNVPGLGLSTYSKLLYFFKISFNGNPCLILDKRLIDVFAGKSYFNFEQLSNIRYNNAEKKYLHFLELIKQIANNMETEGENIELFLFNFGNNLKPINIFSNFWDGYCPESLLNGKTVRMRLNQYDFFESEETGLQICIISGVQAVILNFRGKGKFRETPTYGDEVENGEILSPQNSDRAPFNDPTTIFEASEEIENYIAKIQ
jgi:hypothetical protein